MDIDQTSVISTLAMSLFIHRKYSSTKGIPRLSSADRALVTIPDDIRDILVGILLGDGKVRQVVFIVLLFLLDINISVQDNLELTLMSIPFAGLTPVFTYSNPKLEKSLILANNKGKSGVYL